MIGAKKIKDGCPSPNKRLKRDCQRVAFPVPLSRGGYGCCD
ncbi:transcriptional regulator [Vibrio cholerae]|nr:transcriptional regulator [Vibrio cholerae]NAO59031.1 transcriptional regulator [Vibrio cholerae]TXX35400.1 transcriptional regulator [Vibrio cholerae]TXY09212.1 transcriptional regulator [Vibrio cholerae]TXY22002.1 transcriptional regulator [Vibrio cholerae]